MWRLRTTTGLSFLALLIGIGGTGWLSSLTSRWQPPSDRVAMVRRTPATPTPQATARRRHAPLPVLQPRRGWRADAGDDHVAALADTPAAPTLQPLATPADAEQRWDQLRGHLDGRVLVRLRINPAGGVDSASVIASSGDPILDEHALRTVRGWRFAVPAEHPDGVSGELPMLFSSRGNGLSML